MAIIRCTSRSPSDRPPKEVRHHCPVPTSAGLSSWPHQCWAFEICGFVQLICMQSSGQVYIAAFPFEFDRISIRRYHKTHHARYIDPNRMRLNCKFWISRLDRNPKIAHLQTHLPLAPTIIAFWSFWEGFMVHDATRIWLPESLRGFEYKLWVSLWEFLKLSGELGNLTSETSHAKMHLLNWSLFKAKKRLFLACNLRQQVYQPSHDECTLCTPFNGSLRSHNLSQLPKFGIQTAW